MFVFNNIMELAEWLDQHAKTLIPKAASEKGVKKKFTEGQICELRNIAELIRSKSIVIKEPEPKTIYVENKKEEVKERASGANNSFLQWVRQNYSPKTYQEACKRVEDGQTEEEIRRYLSTLKAYS